MYVHLRRAEPHAVAQPDGLAAGRGVGHPYQREIGVGPGPGPGSFTGRAGQGACQLTDEPLAALGGDPDDALTPPHGTPPHVHDVRAREHPARRDEEAAAPELRTWTIVSAVIPVGWCTNPHDGRPHGTLDGAASGLPLRCSSRCLFGLI